MPPTKAAACGSLCPDTTCGFVHWNNPLPVVAAIVEYEGKILLARNAAWVEGMFALITGFLENGETPEEGIAREVLEETSLHAESVELVGVYEFIRKNELIIAYHVKAHGTVRCRRSCSNTGWSNPRTCDRGERAPGRRLGNGCGGAACRSSLWTAGTLSSVMATRFTGVIQPRLQQARHLAIRPIAGTSQDC